MNATKPLKYEQIKEQLKKEDNISIISCNTCVRLSETGGESKLKEMAMALRKDGFKVLDGYLITMPCQDHYMNNIHMSPLIDTIVMLCCTAGCSNASTLFPGKKVVTTLEDRGMIIVSPVKMKDGTVKMKKTWRRTKK